MGIESANYVLVPKAGIKHADEVLESLSAFKREIFPASNFQRWVVQSERYWIDVMKGEFGPKAEPAVSCRLALCNPSEADDVLRVLLSSFMTRMPGVLFDKQSRQSYQHWSEDTWLHIRDGLTRKRAEFQQNFGPLEAAISGEDVFPTLRMRQH